MGCQGHAVSVRIKDMQQLSASTPRNLLSNVRSVPAPVLLLLSVSNAQLFTKLFSFIPRNIVLSISLFLIRIGLTLFIPNDIASDEYMLKKNSLIPMQHFEGRRRHLSSYFTH